MRDSGLLRAIGIGLSEKSKEETGRDLVERMAPVPELIFSMHQATLRVTNSGFLNRLGIPRREHRASLLHRGGTCK
jgi:hypothetical protein